VRAEAVAGEKKKGFPVDIPLLTYFFFWYLGEARRGHNLDARRGETTRCRPVKR